MAPRTAQLDGMYRTGKETPLVSIVIPVYNGANYMREAIDSALAQTYANCEVIVVNDGSRDDGATDAIARSYGQRIRYFAKENGGVGSALNLGIDKMEGEYFSWLSHDDVYKPDKVRAQVACYDTLDAETLLYGGYELFWGDGSQIAVDFAQSYPAQRLDTGLFPVFYGLLNGCTLLIHKSHFARAGRFDESLPTTQDYDLWFRIFNGARPHYCTQINVRTRLHAAQGSRRIEEHLAEASALWIRLMGELQFPQMCEISGTPRQFYAHMRDMCAGAPYAAAADYAAQRLAALPQTLVAMGDGEKDALITALMDGYDAQLAWITAGMPAALPNARALLKRLAFLTKASLRSDGLGKTARRVAANLFARRKD